LKEFQEEFTTGPGINGGRREIPTNGSKDTENGKRKDVHITNV
tara:strand:+ start:385 stop:513 length:129 start_codon:yes stop_codon:yes gene_type:complete